MEYLIIILVIALALAPLSHFVPSKRQRAVARMREQAAVSGLFVEFRQLPSRGEVAKWSSGTLTEGVIYYGRRLSPAKGDKPVRGRWLRQDGGAWQSLGGADPAPKLLDRFPPEVLAASVDEGSCGIYWRESASEDKLPAIISVIVEWAETLRPQPG